MSNMKLLLLHPRISPIIFLNSPNYTISEKFVLIKDYIDGLPFTTTHDDFDEYNMHVLAAPTGNYYERGTISPPLYVSNMIKLQETVYTMHWPLLCVHELFFYDMPMHRKRVRLRHYMIYVTLCSLLHYKSLLIKIGFDILGIRVDSLLEHYMPSLMALKKALPGRQPGSFRGSFISVEFFYIV